MNINKLNNDLTPVKTNYEIENKLLLKILSTKKPLHFREGKKCQNPKKWSYKELNWVSRAVLSTDKDDVDFLKMYTKTFEKRLIY